MRFLFCVEALRGHFYSFVPLAEELRRRGHELHWLLRYPDPETAEICRRLGSSVRLVEEAEAPSTTSHTSADQSTKLSGFEQRVARFRRLMIEGERIDVTIDAIKQVAPDYVVTDACNWDTTIACAALDVPFASVHTSLGGVAPTAVACERQEVDRLLSDDRARMFERYGVQPFEFRRFECISPHLNIVWSSPELIDASNVPARTELVGVSLPEGNRDVKQFDVPWDSLTGRPLVYISFGTIYYNRSDVIVPVVRGLADLEVNVLLAALELPRELADDLPSNCQWVPFAPQLDVLRRASVFVTHGGHSSFLESMRLGVPLLLIPFASDQFIQAHYVEAAGSGVALASADVTAARVRELVGRMIEPDSRERTNANRLSRSYEQLGGARTAALRIEESAAASTR